MLYSMILSAEKIILKNRSYSGDLEMQVNNIQTAPSSKLNTMFHAKQLHIKNLLLRFICALHWFSLVAYIHHMYLVYNYCIRSVSFQTFTFSSYTLNFILNPESSTQLNPQGCILVQTSICKIKNICLCKIF